MTWYIAIGAIAIVSLAIVSPFSLNPWLKLAIAAAVTVVVGLVINAVTSVQTLGPSASIASESPFREMLLFCMMALGMMARMLSVAIEQRRREMNAGGEIGRGLAIDRWELLYPMLFAIPTFGAVLTQIPAGELKIPEIILAFQNGFFWQTLLKKSESS